MKWSEEIELLRFSHFKFNNNIYIADKFIVTVTIWMIIIL